MSYQVLARKWRPRNFLQMVGQEHILRMLANALDKQRLHHAYLFTGTRGVGKTTLARILAKCLNCEAGISSNPCGTCSICESVDAGRFLDLLEIDAASRTKVEDTRELLDNVQYAPTQGRYKIYLIDEVHMLSGHSFNALLKTLEEPPEHVKFLLATTDPKRLPITVLSRCLQFNLKRVPVEKIATHLQHICITENIPFEAGGLEQLAQAADGSMRDALSLLDQAIAFCHDNITAEDVRNMLGNVEQDALFRLLNALADHDGKQLLAEIKMLSDFAPDFSQILENLLACLHQIAIAQTIQALPEMPAAITEFAKKLSREDVQLYYQIALIGRRDLPLAASPQQGFEMVMLRMLAFNPVTTTTKPQASISTPKVITPTQITSTPPATTSPTTTPVVASDHWTAILSHLGLSGLTYALAANCALDSINDTKIHLVLSKKHQPMLNPKAQERIAEALTRYFKKQISLQITLSDAELDTTAKQQESAQKTRLANAVDAITNDTQVKKIMDVFEATLDINSIKAIDPA